jgi:ATP-binding cassette subfamily G (WHITE) protein 2 (SNQ2)
VIPALRIGRNAYLLIFVYFYFRYQAGESIYELFDKVLVLDQGRQVFYGPPSQARAYFENLGFQALPRQSTADYLTGCTDPNERRFAPGRSAQDVPATPEAMDDAFHRSAYDRTNKNELAQYKLYMETEKADQEAFRAAVAADKKKGVSKKSPYTLGFTGQVKALTVRQFQQKLQDRFQLATSYFLSTVSYSLFLLERNTHDIECHALSSSWLLSLELLLSTNP